MHKEQNQAKQSSKRMFPMWGFRILCCLLASLQSRPKTSSLTLFPFLRSLGWILSSLTYLILNLLDAVITKELTGASCSAVSSRAGSAPRPDDSSHRGEKWSPCSRTPWGWYLAGQEISKCLRHFLRALSKHGMSFLTTTALWINLNITVNMMEIFRSWLFWSGQL